MRSHESAAPSDRQRADEEDTALALDARRGKRNAFDELVKRYNARIYTHLFRMMRNREEAEDLTQDTFLRAYRHLPTYDTNRPFRNWIYTIATNVGLNALRSRQRREHLSNADPLLHPADAAVSPAPPNERTERMADAVKQLPPQSAVLIHLHYHEGMRIREAAEVVGITENAAKVALCRARKTLRTLLTESDAI